MLLKKVSSVMFFVVFVNSLLIVAVYNCKHIIFSFYVNNNV